MGVERAAGRLAAVALLALVAACRAEPPPAVDALQPATLRVGDVDRRYHLFVPADAQRPVPLVMVFHGGLGDGLKVAGQTGFHELGAREGFAVVYPDSLEHWGDGRATTAETSDQDMAFVRALRDRLVGEEGIDPRRIYATGPSNGGMFTLRLACEASGMFAAFAPVIASFPEPYAPRCQPERPVPIMMVNGTDDRFIQWSGGEIPRGRLRGTGGRVIPVPQTHAFWRDAAGCAPDAQSTALPDVDPNDGTTVTVRRYTRCRGGAEVVIVEVAGGGHTWPGTPAELGPVASMLVGNTSRDINATAMIWEFLQQYALPEGAAGP